MIYGETGTGKEIIAELIHTSSERRKHELVCVNCAGLPSELVESELFGSRRGSFTGSVDDRMGLIKYADGGTLFLDELSEMPLHMQSKLLRFIQDRRIRRVGNVVHENIDTRIIAAVNKPPQECIQKKQLREDLYYRLSVVTVTVPPLRERRDDIVPLATAYLRYYSAQFERPVPKLSAEAAAMLCSHPWPGNVRQLINTMTRCALLCTGSISSMDLALDPVDTTEDNIQMWLKRDFTTMPVKEQIEARQLIVALIKSKFNRNNAASVLGVTRGTLYSKIVRLGIRMPARNEPVEPQTPHRNGHAIPLDAPSPSPLPVLPAPRDAGQAAESSALQSVELPEATSQD